MRVSARRSDISALAEVFLRSMFNENGSLAQLGERLPYKQDVTGSSPVTPTRATFASLSEAVSC